MNAGPYDHDQYLKGNYALVSFADVEEIILSLEVSHAISMHSQLLF